MTHPPGQTRRTDPTHDRGAVIPIVALLLPVLVLMTAFAVDLGRQRADRRDMQAAADVIALDMSRLADGRTLSEIQTGDALHPAAETALQASADRNGIPRSELTLDWGTWDEVNGYQSVNAVLTAVPDAALIIAQTTTDYFFQTGSGDVTREAIAVNGLDPEAGFSVGSYAATMTTAQANFLVSTISPRLGNRINPLAPPTELDAVSYEGLAGADIPLGGLLPDPRFNAGTPRELLDAEVPMDEFMLASANVLRNQGNVAEADLVEQSITAEMQNLTVRLSDYVAAESGAEDAAMGATVDLPTVIQGAVFQAQCSTDNPQGFEECNAINVPYLSASLPLITTDSSLTVIESPRYAYGPVNTSADTGQIRLRFQPTVGSQHVGTCTVSLIPLRTCLLNTLLVNTVDATVTIDATVSLAGGRTTIQDIDCFDPAALGLDLRSNTNLYNVDLEVTVEFGTRGLLGGLLGTAFGSLKLVGSTNSAANAEDVTFTVAPDVLGETVRSTGAGSFGLAPITLTSSGSTGVLNDLATLGINYTVGNVVDNLVNPLLVDIDNNVLTPLTDLLGLNVTGADLVAHEIDCNRGLIELVG